MQILKLFLRQFNCASVGKQINFDSITMHSMYVKIYYFYFIYNLLFFIFIYYFYSPPLYLYTG